MTRLARAARMYIQTLVLAGALVGGLAVAVWLASLSGSPELMAVILGGVYILVVLGGIVWWVSE